MPARPSLRIWLEKAFGEEYETRQSQTARFSAYGRVTVGDMIAFKDGGAMVVGRVVCLASVAGEAFALSRLLAPIDRGEWWGTFRTTDTLEPIELEEYMPHLFACEMFCLHCFF